MPAWMCARSAFSHLATIPRLCSWSKANAGRKRRLQRAVPRDLVADETKPAWSYALTVSATGRSVSGARIAAIWSRTRCPSFGRVALRDTRAKAERAAATTPCSNQRACRLAHRHCHVDRTLGRVGAGHRIVEEHRWAKSVLLTARVTPLSAQCATSPHVYAPKPRTGRSLSPNGSRSRSRRRHRSKNSVN